MHDPDNPLHHHLPQMEQQVGSEMYELSIESAKLHNQMAQLGIDSHEDGMALMDAQISSHEAQTELTNSKTAFFRVQSGIIVFTSLAVAIPVVGAVWAWGIRMVFGG